MNYLDVFVGEKLRQYYLRIIAINDSNKNYINKNITYANNRDKVRLFKIIIGIKRKYKIDYSDDTKRISALNKEQSLIKPIKKWEE